MAREYQGRVSLKGPNSTPVEEAAHLAGLARNILLIGVNEFKLVILQILIDNAMSAPTWMVDSLRAPSAHRADSPVVASLESDTVAPL